MYVLGNSMIYKNLGDAECPAWDSVGIRTFVIQCDEWLARTAKEWLEVYLDEGQPRVLDQFETLMETSEVASLGPLDVAKVNYHDVTEQFRKGLLNYVKFL